MVHPSEAAVVHVAHWAGYQVSPPIRSWPGSCNDARRHTGQTALGGLPGSIRLCCAHRTRALPVSYLPRQCQRRPTAPPSIAAQLSGLDTIPSSHWRRPFKVIALARLSRTWWHSSSTTVQMALRRVAQSLGPGLAEAWAACSSSGRSAAFSTAPGPAPGTGPSFLSWLHGAQPPRISVPLTQQLPGIEAERPFPSPSGAPPTETTVLDNGVRIVSEASPVRALSSSMGLITPTRSAALATGP